MGYFLVGIIVGLLIYPLVPKIEESYMKRKLKELEKMF